MNPKEPNTPTVVVLIINSQGKEIYFRLETAAQVKDLKQKIFALQGIPSLSQRLHFPIGAPLEFGLKALRVRALPDNLAQELRDLSNHNLGLPDTTTMGDLKAEDGLIKILMTSKQAAGAMDPLPALSTLFNLSALGQEIHQGVGAGPRTLPLIKNTYQDAFTGTFFFVTPSKSFSQRRKKMAGCQKTSCS